MPLPARFRASSAASALCLAALAGSSGACRAVPRAFGADPASARANSADFFDAWASRFTGVHRSPKFHAARVKLGKNALVPSRIFRDTAVWTSRPDSATRQLVVVGSLTSRGYLFAERPASGLPDRTGDSRHIMRLRRLGDDEFEWTTSVDHGVGRMRAADIESVFGALLASAEGRDERAIRADYRAAFPRSSAALGRLFTLDSLRTTPRPDGSTGIDMVASIHPERLKATMPAFAAYVEKYVGPARYRVTLRDAGGVRWFDMAARDKRLVFRMRAMNGRLAPLDGGPVRPMPDSLQLTAEMYAKVLFFTVGVSDLRADFAVQRSADERGWAMRFRRQPEWHLPLASKHLIRSPLRRPFERGGSSLRIAVRDGGQQTIVTRTARGPVKESGILRFLNSLSSTAMGDYAGSTEEQENRYSAEVFRALRDDALALPLGDAGQASSASSAGEP